MNDREGHAVCPSGHRVRPQDEARFDGGIDSIAAARNRAAALLDASGDFDPERRAEVVLVVSELVSNAVQHAPGPYSLLLALLDDGVCVHVRDTSRRVPQPAQPDPNGGGGYGWHLITKLASRVETAVFEDGKVVSAFLPRRRT